MKRDLVRVARYVSARRGDLGLTQEQLAERASVDRKTIYNLESGERWPQAGTRSRVERALGWYPGDLVRLSEGQEPIEYEPPPPGRELLADLVRDRMGELGLTWADVARDAALSERDLEELRRSWAPRSATAAGLDRAMRWQPGSVTAVLAEQRRPAAMEIVPPRGTRVSERRDLADIGPPGEDDFSFLAFSRRGGGHRVYVAWEGPLPEDMDAVEDAFYTFSTMMRGMDSNARTRSGSDETEATHLRDERRASGDS
ncbi:helix-turn-helix transcriptional regulator [Actinomadura roseirufa]|uniref:helix-turn-helix transcriptional regulator n=1 Tax=Actinomadura roseirufa TaxID=2094049 RepID=UPI001040EAB0|nr:helix-turn-helix transcriptional regulator [Actinomadura roseirufa]